jgi:hypothetical protein
MITKKDFLRGSYTNVISEQKTNKDFAEMVSLMLHSQTQIHALHLQTKSYSEHKALQKYYENIDELVDGLVESYQGKYGIIESYKSYDIESYKSTENTSKLLGELCSKIEDLRDCCKDSYIQNQIDTVCELINSTLYKLRFLK